MKKTIIMLCFISVCLHGMENICTKVSLRKGSLYSMDGKVGVMVVGINEQKRLNRTAFYPNTTIVGDTCKVCFNEVYIMNKEDDSSSTEDRDNPCEIMKHRDHNFYSKDMQNPVIGILEPRMHIMQFGKKRKDYYYGNLQGEAAIKDASLDLFNCYLKVLQEGLEIIKDQENKTIAIPLLGSPTGVGMPRQDACLVAVEAISYFAQHMQHSVHYDYIYLFVTKRYEFDWCKNDLLKRFKLHDKSAATLKN